MLNSITEALTVAGDTGAITNLDVVTSMMAALGLGLIIALTYLLTNKSAMNRKGFAITLIMLPIILAVIILFVGSNVARAFSLAGVLSIIRFRSAPGDAKDIGYVFFATGVGVGCGVEMYAGSAIFTVVMAVVMIILEKIKIGDSGNVRHLKITIPEDLNYENVFEEIFNKYTKKHTLQKIRTTELGSLYEINYEVIVKPEINQKDFIDDLRVRNGNLSIMMTMAVE